MSHFLVMVIGADPEKQLAPYHEFECTGEDNEFVKEIDKTDEARLEYERFMQSQSEKRKKRMAEAGGAIEEHDPNEEIKSFTDYVRDYREDDLIPFGQKPDFENSHKYGYALLDENGEVVKVVRRTNPNAKWDWYVLGGRYSGRLLLKEGAKGESGRPGVFGNEVGIDSAMKGDIDFESMRERARKQANADYDLFEKVTKGQPWPESWETVFERYGEKKIDEARAFYNNQPMVKAMRSDRNIHPFDSPEDYGPDRQKYVDGEVKKAGVPFAFIKDSVWYDKGDMGWWGMVSNEKDPKEWQDQFWEAFDAMPDDTLISMYDCHI